MSLDKAVEHGKERKPRIKRGKKIYHRRCACGWCELNRKHSKIKAEEASLDDLHEFIDDIQHQMSGAS